MIRYFRYVEPEVPQERVAPKSPSNETLLAGVGHLELTAPDGPLRKAKKGKAALRKPKVPTTDGSTAPALPLLTGFEV